MMTWKKITLFSGRSPVMFDIFKLNEWTENYGSHKRMESINSPTASHRSIHEKCRAKIILAERQTKTWQYFIRGIF